MPSIEFSPSDPFPLLPPGRYDYAEAQLHSEKVDHWLGIPVDAVEAELARAGRTGGPYAGAQAWIGLKPQALLTPYIELRTMLERLKPGPGETWADLGCAYGRLGFVMARHAPEARFVGLELVAERVRAGSESLARFAPAGFRWSLETADLSDAALPLPEAGTYFVYDFGTREAISSVLEALRLRARSAPIRVIGRGRATRDAIERSQPWLSQVTVPEHFGNFTIYRS